MFRYMNLVLWFMQIFGLHEGGRGLIHLGIYVEVIEIRNHTHFLRAWVYTVDCDVRMTTDTVAIAK